MGAFTIEDKIWDIYYNIYYCFFVFFGVSRATSFEVGFLYYYYYYDFGFYIW
ncbi:hypothetical protein ESCAB7627_1376 [Escherichia albertii TW07627]|uniref:Uncharacterized protein n=1 Tax=Escherichia albertii (strain TW07627) TaxID=502347 RepID=A0ABC9NRG1_ESCAT|nr:hypothetical protein ESCAB7627_1376 [Escherichia albertii TW07627]